MLHPRRKFLTSCYRKFNFSCDCEMQFLAMLEQLQEKCESVFRLELRKNENQIDSASMRSGIALTYQAVAEGKRHRLLPVFRLQFVLQTVHIPIDRVV
ncbi:hypothetical protein ACVINI_004437 [Rhizobium beringeri]